MFIYPVACSLQFVHDNIVHRTDSCMTVAAASAKAFFVLIFIGVIEQTTSLYYSLIMCLYSMVELQRRLAQDYQRQREFELSRQMSQIGVADRAVSNDQTVLARRADVDRFGSGSPHPHQTCSQASRDHVDHASMAQFTTADPRLAAAQRVMAGWPQSDTGSINHDRRQLDQAKNATNGSTTVDDFVQQLKSRSAK